MSQRGLERLVRVYVIGRAQSFFDEKISFGMRSASEVDGGSAVSVNRMTNDSAPFLHYKTCYFIIRFLLPSSMGGGLEVKQ
jgi:hypothetical protein